MRTKEDISRLEDMVNLFHMCELIPRKYNCEGKFVFQNITFNLVLIKCEDGLFRPCWKATYRITPMPGDCFKVANPFNNGQMDWARYRGIECGKAIILFWWNEGAQPRKAAQSYSLEEFGKLECFYADPSGK